MRDILQRILAFFSNMSKKTRNILIAAVAVAIIAIVAISVFFSNTGYEVAFSGIADTNEMREMLVELGNLNIPTRSTGDSISVPKGQKYEAVLALAQKGYPKTGSMYDIYEKAAGMGTTDADRAQYANMQLQMNLARTLEAMEKIEQATVYVTPSNEGNYVLNKDKRDATASVILRLPEGETLNAAEVKAVSEVVAKAVEGLSPEEVAITDTKMNAYTLEENATAAIGDQMQTQTAVQSNFEARILRLLEPVFGKGGVTVAVNAELDFDNTTIESVVFASPNDDGEGIVVSSLKLYEIVRGGTDGEVVGFDPNGAAPSYEEVAGDPDAYYAKISEELNREVNETRTLIEKAKGGVKKLSVSVMIDSTKNANSLAYTDQVKELVAQALGIENMDLVSVHPMPFKEAVDTMSEAYEQQQVELAKARQASLLRQLIWAGLGLIIAILVFLIVMRLIRGKRQEQLVTPEGVDVFIDEDGIVEPDEPFITEVTDPTLSQLEEYVDSSPESVAQLLRNWLSNE